MNRLYLVVAVSVLVAAAAIGLLAGCGGGGSSPGPEVKPPVTTAPVSAHFRVDVDSGNVSVTTPTGTATRATVGTKAVLTGTAVRFSSSTLVDEGGDAGVKALAVTVRNQTGRQLTGARLVFSDITTANGLPDLTGDCRVSTLAGTGSTGFANGAPLSASFRSPSGVAVDDQGAVYIADYSNNAVRKLSGGRVSTLAGSGTAGETNGLGTAATLTAPIGIVYLPSDPALYVAEYSGHCIRRIELDGMVSTVAGTGTAGATEVTGDVAQFNQPVGLATDGTNIYVAERAGHRIRRIRYTGTNRRAASSFTVSTVAGNGTAGAVDGLATTSRFNGPFGLTWGSDGVLYVAEYDGKRIRRVTAAGATITIAGTGASGSADGHGNTATFASPSGAVAVPDTAGSTCLIVADQGNNIVRQVRLKPGGSASDANSWLVQTLAGNAGGSGSTNGSGTDARFNVPKLLGADASGNILVPDAGNHLLRRVAPIGGHFPLGIIPSTSTSSEPVRLANAAGWLAWMGGDNYPYLTCPDLAAGATSDPLTWSFSVPDGVGAFEFDVTVEGATAPYSPPIAVDGGTSGGIGSSEVMVRTLAGAGPDGFIDGYGANARFSCTVGLAADSAGVLYVADAENDSIRRVDPSGRVSTVAGPYPGTSGYANGRGNVAKFAYPTDVAVVPEGVFSSEGGTSATYLVVADLDNDRVRLIRCPSSGWSPTSPAEPWNPAYYDVTSIAGDGTSGYNNGRGDTARFAAPSAVAVGPGGIVYVLERTGGNRVRTLQWTGGDPMDSTHWQVSLLAGATDGSAGYVDAPGTIARFDDPRGITVGPDGAIYVADTYNHCIRQISPDGIAFTLAGTDSSGYEDDSGTNARFYCPWDVAAGPDGYLYVADRYNHLIRRVSPTGTVTTVAGTGSGTRADGLGSVAGFTDDLGIAVTPGGDLYVSEAECLRVIQRIVGSGTATAQRR